MQSLAEGVRAYLPSHLHLLRMQLDLQDAIGVAVVVAHGYQRPKAATMPVDIHAKGVVLEA